MQISARFHDSAPKAHRLTKCGCDLRHLPARVMVIGDELNILSRFSDAIVSEPMFCLAGAVTTGADAMALLVDQMPDVVLVDLDLPDVDGVELIRRIIKHCRDVNVLVVTKLSDYARVISSIQAGAAGYLLKDDDIPAIIASIHTVRAGGSPIAPSIARKILTQLRCMKSIPLALPSLVGTTVLSARETEALHLMSKGLSFDEVSANLQISRHTVVAHVKKIYRKLGVNSRSEAVYEARQLGLL